MKSIWCVHLVYGFEGSRYDEVVRVFFGADEALDFCYKILRSQDFYESESEPDYMTLWRYDSDENGGYAQIESPHASWFDLDKKVRLF